jgi:hypothetical protein
MGLRLTKTNMKLYATTTSERASKGQGGKWIEIEVKDENKEIIAIMKFSTPPEGVKDKTLLGYWFSDELLKVEIKGNKQKDELRYCTWCGDESAQTGTKCKFCGHEMHCII